MTIAGDTIKSAQKCKIYGNPRWLRIFALLFGMLVTLGTPLQAVASIQNRVSVKNERIDDISKIIRCAAFFQTISGFRGRETVHVDLFKDVSDSLLDRAVEYLTLDITAETEIAVIRSVTEEQHSLFATAYRTMLREEFGLARASTFVTYDLLMVQEDLKFCRDTIQIKGLTFDKPLPVR